MRTKLVDAGYVILGADLLARELPAELQELIGEPTQRERKRDINSYRINEMPLFDDPRLTSALFVDAQRPYVMVNKPEEYTDRGSARRLEPKRQSSLGRRSMRVNRSVGQLLQLEQ